MAGILWTIIVILFIFWLLGFMVWHVGGIIHLLLVVAVIVLLFSFAIPFLLLLSRDVKRTAGIVSKIAIWMIFMRLVDLYWMTRPEFTSRAVPTWLDIVVPVALIGLWLGFFAMNLKQRPLLPVGDPNLSEALAQNEH